MARVKETPIFFDPSQNRWRTAKLGFVLLGLVASLLLVMLLSSFLVNPILPVLSMPLKRFSGTHRAVTTKKPDTDDDKNAQLHLKKTIQPAATIFSASKTAIQSNNTSQNNLFSKTNHGTTIGFYVNWDDNSFTSLKENIDKLDVLTPEWLHLGNAGAINLDDPVKQARVLDFIAQTKPHLKIVPLINNYDAKTQAWNGPGLAQVLSNQRARNNLEKNLLQFVQSNKFEGINIDFETIPDAAQHNLLLFMTELYKTFHAKGFVLQQSVPLDDPAFLYAKLAKATDALVLMAYDEHTNDDEIGPVASQAWLSQHLEERLKDVPVQKLVLGLGNYGYDWTANNQGEEVSYQEALATAADNSDAKIQLDPTALNPHYNYTDEHNRLHHVWYMDATTSFNAMHSANALGVHSLALWRLGTEDPSVWNLIEHHGQTNANMANSLETMHYGYDLSYKGNGEILKVTSTPKNGKRALGLNAKGFISSERILGFASPYVISRWGASHNKQIALTFDDGPDPIWTTKILDVLKHEHVPATFFVVGEMANSHPELLRRMLNENHEIGSHTFTHPNLSLVTTEQIKLELNATQRLLESTLGVSSVLFRPPFAEDIEPATPDQAGVIDAVSKLGYYTIGMGIDPLDWQAPNAKTIVQRVLTGVQNQNGQIVLLHDAGGDRSQTVAALPELIHALKAKGYNLVAVSSLMKLSRQKIMPNINQTQRLQTAFDGTGFRFIANLQNSLAWLFIFGIAFSSLRLLFIVVLALLEHARRNKKVFADGSQVPVSVIVPAYNEAKVIINTVCSILQNGHGPLEILVVDDGSKDETFATAMTAFANHPQVFVYSKTNGGKYSALNFGLARSKHDTIVIVDADTVLQPGAIGKLARHFFDPRIAAIAGNAKVGNRLNLMTRWQALEYITSQNLDRRAFAWLNCISVVPGAIGAWRKEAVLAAGGFSGNTLAEDSDLTLRLLRDGHIIGYEPEAIAMTEAPDTVQAFLNQRFRWMFGTLQAAYKHADTIFQPRYKALGSFALPNVFVFQVLFPFVSGLMDLAMLSSLVWAVLQMRFHPAENTFPAISHALFFYLLFLMVDFGAALIAFCLEKNEDWRLLPWLLLQRFFYRQLMYLVAIRAAIAALRGHTVAWGRLERKATVGLPTAKM